MLFAARTRSLAFGLALGLVLSVGGAAGCATGTQAATSEPPASEAAATTAGPEAMSEAEMAELQKQMAEQAEPGPEHEILAKMAGDWVMQTTLTMGPEPMEAESTVHSELILGGRFLTMHTIGGEGPMKMEAFTVMGYDRRHQAFTIYGCDTMGTYCVGGEGPWDAATKTMTMYGEDEDTTAGLVQKYDIVVTMIDDDHMRTQVIFKPGTFGNAEPLVAVTNLSTRKK